ncbi:hypothetical protein ABB37_00913 [Leptomonas pyrrhocoris]|uniref:RING-type domain-containing protein n=1 Tax=Leptomonas pyrrhocoris TaxID=157538 RepID=A0A0M9GBM7_LEPPY|nr:hypothetical protein ABB37_00913 [Leptomonas pyrrhocoris]XP_015665306.1 hypothetical protein ABB37_00913 [Leptomonas pyrrhocoris]KPA86866.1 hypothetical protein ABB37_00913 [Leptomonas pyrrhocoris]KPA86867.1 hypothetical protein ABB37_00913 [Leptomonas pyrrhocoris]|eukprot:XP_015665305.1 hypothetical protein ABB37_00913 [Leptomonas pyrrhocoris]
MLLHEALLQSECPICLQPLHFAVVPPPPSRPASTLSGASPSSLSTPSTPSNYVSSTTHSPIAPSGRLIEVDNGGEFQITFAPGVYGSDLADPWHPTFEILSSNSSSSSAQSISADETHSTPSSDEAGSTFSFSSSESSHSIPTTRTHGTPSDESASGVAVLPCGHLLHYVCAMQLFEYATGKSCPVCRKALISRADVVLFCPRVRTPPHPAASIPTATSERAASTRKRRRNDADTPSDQLPSQNVLGGCSSVTVRSADDAERSERAREEVLGGTQLVGTDSDAAQLVVPLDHERGVRASSALIRPLAGASNAAALSSSSVLHRSHASGEASRPTPTPAEDDILLLGARQLPPAQAYADLLLRSTATWADRTDVLKARVTHLEGNQRQLQNDCAELERMLAAARRRRELLLNLPSAAHTGGNGVDALPSYERLQELRRLGKETRTAMTEVTAQLAASTRAHAEVRRQIEKYSRKLARLKVGGDVEKEAEFTVKDGKSQHMPSQRSTAANTSGSDGGDRGASGQSESAWDP